MAEALILLEVLPAAVEACVRSYKFWKQAENIGKDGVLFLTRLNLQEARFETWKADWGIAEWSEVKMEGVGFERFRKYPVLALNYIHLIDRIVSELQSLDSVFPALKAAMSPDSPSAAVARLSEVGQADHKGLTAKMLGARKESSTKQRLKWAKNKTRTDKALSDLTLLTNDLIDFFQPPKREFRISNITEGNFPPQALTERIKNDPAEDGHTAAEAGTDSATYGTGDESLLSSLASLKDMVKRQDLLPEIKTLQKRKLDTDSDSGRDSQTNRSICKVQGDNYLVEWKTVQTEEVPGKEKKVLKDRVKNVARLLQAEGKPEELRTLDCKWVIEDKKATTTDYRLLYRLQSSGCFSLRQLLDDKGSRLLLGDRFAMALILARALLYLHYANWLHKGIRSDNVLFVADAILNINPAWPYLGGFEMSRPNQEHEMTEDPVFSRAFNLYRHPECQGIPVEPDNNEQENHNDEAGERLESVRPRYREEYDIYSLGVVLLEIGLGSTIEKAFDAAKSAKQENPKKNTHSALSGTFSAENFRAWMVDEKVPELGPRMGAAYRDATRTCISGNIDVEKRTLETAFYVDVVGILEDCHV